MLVHSRSIHGTSYQLQESVGPSTNYIIHASQTFTIKCKCAVSKPPIADPDFDRPARIDMLLGCDVFPYLIRPCSKIIHSDSLPSALDTYLGWVLVGTVVNSSSNDHLASSNSLSITLNPSLDTLLHRFWSVEEPATPSIPTTEDELCEKWFKQTVSRNASGRFCVELPF